MEQLPDFSETNLLRLFWTSRVKQWKRFWRSLFWCGFILIVSGCGPKLIGASAWPTNNRKDWLVYHRENGIDRCWYLIQKEIHFDNQQLYWFDSKGKKVSLEENYDIVQIRESHLDEDLELAATRFNMDLHLCRAGAPIL